MNFSILQLFLKVFALKWIGQSRSMSSKFVFLWLMVYSNIPSAQTLVLSFKAWNLKNIVISPGSRNAPLVLGFTKNAFFRCFSVVDERCAAFFALGMAQHLREPVAVVCTSGSAVLNYYPAVGEAFYSGIPLVVVSADRPGYKVEIGDGQTIRQHKVLDLHVGYSAQLKQDVSHATEVIARYAPALLKENQPLVQQYNEKELAKALAIAVEDSTPVHINIPFEEPLYGTTLTPGVRVSPPFLPPGPQPGDWESLRHLWNAHPNKMVLAGVNPPDAFEQEVLEALARDPGVVVLTETTSNIHHADFFPAIDSLIVPLEKSRSREAFFQALKPDLLVTFGGFLISKKIKAFLRTCQPKAHWHITPGKAYDTFFCLSKVIKANPNEFFKKVIQIPSVKNGYKNRWLEVKEHYEKKRDLYLKYIPFSDFSVFAQLQKSIPKEYQLHLANSSAVRYAQLFAGDRPSHQVYCNRGTSGIDGSTSTAIGASIYAPCPTLLVTGDLSFFYDSNALWNNYIRADFRIILINNAGGGIFRILPGNEPTSEFETFFETHHQLTAEHLAKMYGFAYYSAVDEEQLEVELQQFYELSQQPKILEITTPRDLNAQILLRYFDFLSYGL